jgi:UDP-N-acetylmuramate dehydrogenase
MMSSAKRKDWRDDLPPVKGELSFDQPLKPLTWFRVGGPAEVLFRPADEEDLIAFLGALPADVPVTMLGVGSNLLVRDGGVAGVVIRLSRAFSTVRVEGEIIRAGAGASDINVAMAAMRGELAGLEFLRGIPGTVGGALRMNAGAYGREIADVFLSARAVDRRGHLHEFSAADMGFSYRHSQVPEDVIFLSAVLRGEKDSPEAIRRRMTRIGEERELSQPVKSATGGSTFKNTPQGRAWELIDAVGGRGLVVGDAEVSVKHCNFLINRGAATAADLENLGEELRRRVREEKGVALEWEIRRIGQKEGGR